MNEQLSLKTLEEKIIKDFSCWYFVVCTDAGLSSMSNRVFKSKGRRDFITTQSIRKLKGYLKDWALDPDGWIFSNDMGFVKKARRKLYNLEKDVVVSDDYRFKYSTFN